jgi:hypothetical protein
MQTGPAVKSYALTAPLVQAIVNYLMKQPWSEVNGLITALQEQLMPQELVPPPAPANGQPGEQKQENARQ